MDVSPATRVHAAAAGLLRNLSKMADIKVVPLGAGQDVGRSCILVTIGGKNVMLDCGMHMGYNDERRFPDFSYITESGRLTEHLDCVIISHFHLDHCGALPYFTEMCGYDGPLYMTQPTKAICPILLEDYRKITVDKKGETNFFTSQMIKDCMKKVTVIKLHQTIKIDDELEIKAYYAGHVLGAAMVHVKVGTQSFVYTGDYNMTPDRHLGAAWIDRCRPDLLISESTYGTTIRDSKKCREHDFLKKVHDCVEKGGKVLIPVFALGRAQELFILLESYWDRMNLNTPIYFTVGLAEKANHYYKLFITWTNQKLLNTFVERNLFDFKHIKPFDRSYTDLPGPMVVFATPGMLHSGQSLQIFKKWASDEKNMLIMPGYCVAGTVGHKVLSGQKEIEIDKKMISVKMSIQYMSFSAHADAKGIMQLIRMAEPKNVLLVHGEAAKMKFLSKKIKQEFGVDCFMPANGETVSIATPPVIVAAISETLLKRTLETSYSVPVSKRPHHLPNMAELHGLLVAKDDKLKLIDPSEAGDEVGVQQHQVVFHNTIAVDTQLTEKHDVMDKVYQNANKMFPHLVLNRVSDTELVFDGTTVKVSVQGLDGKTSKIEVSWNYADDTLGENVLSSLQRSLQRVL